MSRDGQTFKVSSTTYLVVKKLDPEEEPYVTDGHRLVSLMTGRTLEVSEVYLADLEEKGKRIT